MGMEEDDPLPVDAALLSSSMLVGDVIAGHGVTPFLEAAQAAGCKTAHGDHMVEAAQDLLVEFMLQACGQDLATASRRATNRVPLGIRSSHGPSSPSSRASAIRRRGFRSRRGQGPTVAGHGWVLDQ